MSPVIWPSIISFVTTQHRSWQVLASAEVLSSSDAESSDEEEDINQEFLDEMGKNLENMLANKKTSSQFLRLLIV